jgi:hypothetical protein
VLFLKNSGTVQNPGDPIVLPGKLHSGTGWRPMVPRQDVRHVLPDGTTMIVESGPARIIEVTPEKEVVWTFKDFKTFGNSLPVAVVLDP